MFEKTITSSEKGQKILKYLLRKTDGSKIFLYKLFRKKEIIVNGEPVGPHYIIKENDRITCERLNEFKLLKKKFNYNIDVIYLDKTLIVVDKEPGLPVYGKGNSLINQVSTYLTSNNFPGEFIVPVHRLDKETGGIVIFALTYQVAKELTELFRERKVRKVYQGIVEGIIDKKIFVEAEIKRNGRVSVIKEIRTFDRIPLKEEWISNSKFNSATIVSPVSVKENNTCVEIEIWTGLHHQIRSVLKEINHPLVNDRKYGERKNQDNIMLLCKRIEIPDLNLCFESRKNLF
jgi:23S rRNA-/tRNA-specific pseudouridylate synthase